MFRVAGGFAEPVRLALARDTTLVAEIARRILNAHFPESIRQDVADAVGLDLDAFASKLAPTIASMHSRASSPPQSPRCIRERARSHSCCVCGHDLRMGGEDTKAKLLAHHGAGLIQPQGKECLPQPEFLAWHRAEVFKEPARE